jgi:glycine/D-amino acid oxidase-like deaminating enzyme
MGRQVYDVVIVGAGQAGLIVGLALKREGVRNVLLLDRNPAGSEGPWDTFARMEVLRTPKTLVGAELGMPSLSVRCWFEARYGAAAWQKIGWVQRRARMRYLRRYRSIADLTIHNEVGLSASLPRARSGGEYEEGRLGPDPAVLARRVVIATGHDGGGLWAVPDMVSKGCCAHVYAPIQTCQSTCEIDRTAHRHSRSRRLAFDADSRRCKPGAASVDLCFRRPRLPVDQPIAGWNGLPSWPITASSMTARAGMSGAISISKISRRHATPSIVPAPNRVSESTAIAPGARSRGTEPKSR